MDQDATEPVGKELWLWLRGVFTQWKAGMTGGILIFLIGAIAILAKTNIDPRVFLAVSGLILFEAMFLAWRDQHHGWIESNEKVSKAEADLRAIQIERKPDLNCIIESCTQLTFQLNADGGFGTNLLVEICIRNGGARTALDDWRLEVPSITDAPLSHQSDPWQQMFFKQKRFADLAQLAKSGIGRGDICRGHLIFAVPGLTKEAIKKPGVRAVVTFSDALADIYLVEWTKPIIEGKAN